MTNCELIRQGVKNYVTSNERGLLKVAVLRFPSFN